MNFSAHKHKPGPSRSELTGMLVDFFDRGGQVRTFKRGFTSDFIYLQPLMKSFGYEVKAVKNRYIVCEIGSSGKPEKISREQALTKINSVLVENGMPPFMITKHEFLPERSEP